MSLAMNRTAFELGIECPYATRMSLTCVVAIRFWSEEMIEESASARHGGCVERSQPVRRPVDLTRGLLRTMETSR